MTVTPEPGPVAEPPSRLPLPWRLTRGLLHVGDAIWKAFGLRQRSIVRGAVLVAVPTEMSEAMNRLFPRTWQPRFQSNGFEDSGRDPEDYYLPEEGEPIFGGAPYTVGRIRCIPGSEQTFVATVLQAWTRLARNDPATILSTPFPATQLNSVPPLARDPLQHALAQMNLPPNPDAGDGVTVVVVDNGLVPELIPGISVPRIPITGEDQPDTFLKVPVARRIRYPHGSAVVALVAAAAPNAQLRFMELPKTADYWLPSILDHAHEENIGQKLVINLSWSFNLSNLKTDQRQIFRHIVDGEFHNARRKMVILAAGGNCNIGDPHPAPMEYPASSPNVIGVLSSTASGQIAMQSRHGKDLGPWCTAPGGYAPDSQPTGLITLAEHAFWGTSMACALASGYVASGFVAPTSIAMLNTLAQKLAGNTALK